MLVNAFELDAELKLPSALASTVLPESKPSLALFNVTVFCTVPTSPSDDEPTIFKNTRNALEPLSVSGVPKPALPVVFGSFVNAVAVGLVSA